MIKITWINMLETSNKELCNLAYNKQRKMLTSVPGALVKETKYSIRTFELF